MRIDFDYEKYTNEELRILMEEMNQVLVKRTEERKKTLLKNVIDDLTIFAKEFPGECILNDLDWGEHNSFDLIYELKRYNEIE